MRIPARLQPYVFAAVASLVLASFAAYDLVRERSRSVDQAKANTANVARLLEEHARQSLRRIEGLLADAEARLDDLPAAAGAQAQSGTVPQQLKALLPGDGLVGAMVWQAADGTAVVSAGHKPNMADAALADWQARVRAAPSGRLVVGRPWRDASGAWLLPVGRLVVPADGARGQGGTLLALVDAKALQPVLDAVDTGRNGFVTLFLRDGWMLATAPHNPALFGRNWGDAPMFTQHLVQSPTGTVQQVVVRDGTERVYSYRALAEYPVVVSSGISMTDALADWRARVGWESLMLALVTSASLAGAAAMSRSTTRREAAERVSGELALQTQAVVDHAADGIVTFDQHGQLATVNRAGAAMFGYPAAALIGQPVGLLLPALAAPGAAAALQARDRVECDGRCRDGSVLATELAVTKVPHGDRVMYTALIQDITARRRAQAEVAQARDTVERSERLLRAITDNLPLRIAYVDSNLRYRFANKLQGERFGSPVDAVIGHTHEALTGVPPSVELQARIDRVLQGVAQRFEIEEIQDGDARVFETFLVPDQAADGQVVGFYAAGADVSERHAQQQRIAQALAERETLLREVYHRVKNNLQVIQSLLNLQRRALPEGLARAALDDSVQRVHAMALVHEKLYQTGHLDAIALRDYTTDLLRHLGDTGGAHHRGVALVAEVDEIEASLEVSVPFGLLVSELVGNSLKHGFPAGRGGTIRVSLRREAAGAVRLTVRDDGLGLPPGFDLDQAGSMGLQLASSLAGQMGGRLSAGNDGGAVFSVNLAHMA